MELLKNKEKPNAENKNGKIMCSFCNKMILQKGRRLHKKKNVKNLLLATRAIEKWFIKTTK